jgi:hypothetical protein
MYSADMSTHLARFPAPTVANACKMAILEWEITERRRRRKAMESWFHSLFYTPVDDFNADKTWKMLKDARDLSLSCPPNDLVVVMPGLLKHIDKHIKHLTGDCRSAT